MDTTEQLHFHFHALEKEMATHSCSCLENPRDGGAWWAAIYEVAQSRTRLKRLSSSSSSSSLLECQDNPIGKKIAFSTNGGFPGGSEIEASACNVGDLGSIPGSGRSPREGNGNPLQYSCLENPTDGGAGWVPAMGLHRVRQTQLSDFTFTK